MDKVSVFESSDFGELRIIVDPKGDVWFVASDVAKSLGYINAKDAVKRHVDDDDSMMGRCPICLCNVLFGWFSEGLQM